MKVTVELDRGCSPQPKVLPQDPLPNQLPSSCKGAAWLMVARNIGSFIPTIIPRAAGKLYTACDCPCLWADTCCGGEGYWALEECHGCCQLAFILQDPAMVFVPEEEAVISKKWIPVFVYKSRSLLLASLKTTQDAFHSYTCHQTVTEETIKMEVHPTYVKQVLNPHIWILLDLKLSITSTGVLRQRISRFVSE